MPEPADRAEAIAALARVSHLRAAVDDFERTAIDAARTGGASWAEIATALGLASRQAAEQRRARLKGGGPERQHKIDNLRRALENLAKLLETTPTTGSVHLARQTLTIALDAPPGQQIDLARLIVGDLRQHAGTRPLIAAAIGRIAALTSIDSTHTRPQN